MECKMEKHYLIFHTYSLPPVEEFSLQKYLSQKYLSSLPIDLNASLANTAVQ